VAQIRAAIKTDYLSGFLGMELLKDESKSIFSTNSLLVVKDLVWNNPTRQKQTYISIWAQNYAHLFSN